MLCGEAQHQERSHVSVPLSAPSSIDLSGVPARVAEAVAQVVAVCHEQFRPDPCPEAFEEAELRVRETMNALACELLGAVIEKRDDGASRIERDGQSWFRVAVTAKTIMTSLGPLTYRRARYRSGASGASPVPVDESLGLVDDYLTRPAAELGLLMMGHCTAREAAAFFAKIGGMTPSVSTLQRLTRTMHERWETLGPETLDSIRDAEGVPHEAVSASVSLDGVMVPLRAGEKAAGAAFDDVVRIRFFVVDYKPSDIGAIGDATAAVFSAEKPPASLLIGVQSLYAEDYLVEIEVTAVVE